MPKLSRCKVRGHHWAIFTIRGEHGLFDVRACTRCRLIAARGTLLKEPPLIDDYEIVEG